MYSILHEIVPVFLCAGLSIAVCFRPTWSPLIGDKCCLPERLANTSRPTDRQLWPASFAVYNGMELSVLARQMVYYHYAGSSRLVCGTVTTSRTKSSTMHLYSLHACIYAACMRGTEAVKWAAGTINIEMGLE